MDIGVDSGGTFTDVVAADGRLSKVLSTPEDPSRAVRDGVAGVLTELPETVVHGTTVATNTLLERSGARVALLTTAGFADVIEIGRQLRPSLFDHFADRPRPLVDRDMRFEVAERMGPDGAVLTPIDVGSLPDADALGRADAVAIAFLHSIVNPEHEVAAASALHAAGIDVSVSHDVAPEFREFERTVTTVVNAYLRPRCREYLDRLDGIARRVLVMTSAGGVVTTPVAGELPVQLLLSGPAGGVSAASAAARANGFPDAVTFDMGGTSTDVCLIRGGRPEPAGERMIAGLPIKAPALDIETIGAGGGSLAWIDPGGALRVGPRSAGADPGPACYGLGGTEPTVTDANLVAGRIPADAEFGDLGRLDLNAAAAALDHAGISADDVIRVVNAEMSRALRIVTIERGIDPRQMALVAFGGAGPLHACELADELGMKTVIVPAAAGVLSAVGLLGAPVAQDHVMAWPGGSDHDGLGEAAARQAQSAAAAVAQMVPGASISTGTTFDCRYDGQSHEITVPTVAAFHDAHRERNGYARPETPVEVVAVRVRAEAAPTSASMSWPTRDSVSQGPVVIAEDDCTIWLPAGWRSGPGADGALLLEKSA
jgi:N-methylhydantoinase A/oxoprolinase/acetone carboxylase beta subunit